jgi:hypothetical protein
MLNRTLLAELINKFQAAAENYGAASQIGHPTMEKARIEMANAKLDLLNALDPEETPNE